MPSICFNHNWSQRPPLIVCHINSIWNQLNFQQLVSDFTILITITYYPFFSGAGWALEHFVIGAQPKIWGHWATGPLLLFFPDIWCLCPDCQFSYLFKSCKEHVAKNLKLCTALGMSTLFANQIGFPWSWDSSAANSSRRDSNMSAIRIIILDLSWTGVTDHL